MLGVGSVGRMVLTATSASALHDLKGGAVTFEVAATRTRGLHDA